MQAENSEENLEEAFYIPTNAFLERKVFVNFKEQESFTDLTSKILFNIYFIKSLACLFPFYFLYPVAFAKAVFFVAPAALITNINLTSGFFPSFWIFLGK